MIENQYNSQQQLPRSTSWTISAPNERERQRVIRKFINSAIYVEKEVREMPPQRKTSSLLAIDDSGDIRASKKCSCSSMSTCSCDSKRNCFPQGKIRNGFASSDESKEGTPESGYRTNSSNENSSDATLKPAKSDPFNSELRLSLTCLSTNRTCTLDPKERQEIVQNWMTKKEIEKKHKALQEAKIAKQREEERQKLIQKERENFKKWLSEKKKEEERKRAQKELEMEEQKLKEAEKEKKKVENEINFNLWLRRKRKSDLEKRIAEKLALINMYEQKQKRLEENEIAYQEWLENTKNRQKPIPMNKGLQSLCSSTSVTYVNPIPWTPNIDPNLKPASM